MKKIYDYLIRPINNSSEESAYLNKRCLSDSNKTLFIFENEYLSYNSKGFWKMLNYLSKPNYENLDLFLDSKSASQAIKEMAKYELDHFNGNSNEIELMELIITIKLITRLSVNLLDEMSGCRSDKMLLNIYYHIIYKSGLTTCIDECLSEANKLHICERCENYVYDVLDYDNVHEKGLFKTLLNFNLHSKNNRKSIKDDLIFNLSKNINKLDYCNPDEIPEKIIYDKITNLKKDLLFYNLSHKVRSKLNSLFNNILNNDIFENERQYYLMNSVLTYSDNNRPLLTTHKLFEMYKNDFIYKSDEPVYHGFASSEYPTIKTLIEKYKEGFISCSKNISVAKDFAEMSVNKDDIDIGYILKIYPDECMESLDIEYLLDNLFQNNNAYYSRLRKLYIREREVLVKLPLSTSFEILKI